jgi:negative regulator of sigma E activity
MNRNEQVSAMLDGELDELNVKQLLSAWTDDENEQWRNHALVGDLIRSSELGRFHASAVVARVQASLENEPTVIAPQVQTRKQRLGMLQRVINTGRTVRVAASFAAIGAISFALHQAVPPLDSQLQLVKSHNQAVVTDQELALWQEYFMAHQQNSVRSGLSGLSPIARVEADRPTLGAPEPRVILSNTDSADWMNVWEPAPRSDEQGPQFNYVSTRR